MAIGAVGLGIGLEYAQLHVGRDFEIGDMVADGVGTVLGLAAGLPLRTRVRKLMWR